jgi:glycosyltransferase involved in cell wall biosynthesis
VSSPPTCRQRHDAGGADAVLHLIDFDEPFGYNVVEAMACGTPVIANSRGSMGKLIKHGVSGFLVAIMVDKYVALYRIIIENPP